jgi:hypothetical protein
MTEIDAVVKTNVSITEMLWVVPFTFDSDLIEEMVAIHFISQRHAEEISFLQNCGIQPDFQET